MKTTEHKKLTSNWLRIIGIVTAIVIILVFLDFALGGILSGWNMPR